MKSYILIIFFLFFSYFNLNAQNKKLDTLDSYIIDSFVEKTNDDPNDLTLSLSFSTDEDVTSKLVLENNSIFNISDSLTTNHQKKISLNGLTFKNKSVKYHLLFIDANGKESTSYENEFELPQDEEVIQQQQQQHSGLLNICLMGSLVFALPSPQVVFWHDKTYFSLTKEIPLAFIRSNDLGYPTGYFSAEYSYTFEAQKKNIFRVGYKHLIDIPLFEFTSPGLTYFTNFKGYNGIAPEITVGFVRLFEAFTLYGRYRFNWKPNEKGSEFNAISIGLYSGYFAVYF